MTEQYPEVLFVCTRGDGRDGIFPIGLIQAANKLRSSNRRGVLAVELEPRVLTNAAVVVLHLHWDFNHLYFHELVKFIRSAAPAARIVVGGYIATVHPQRVIETHDVDYCISGDYEEPFERLVEAILAQRQDAWIRSSVPNVHSRAGAPLATYRVSRRELDQLDGLTIDWFPALQTYTRFQDSLNLLGLAKWTEEQYFPALILKGSFSEHCTYCVLSTQRFEGPCGPELFTYIGEEAFLEFLDDCVGWRGVNVFGDFAALDLPKILHFLEGKTYDFELSIGDLFEEVQIDHIEMLAPHFGKLWLGFRLLPSACYLAEEAISPEMVDTPYAQRLLSLSRASDNISVGFWVNGSNLKTGCDFGPFASRFLYMDGWRRFPTQRPGPKNFARLMERSREFKELHSELRQVRVRCESRIAAAEPHNLRIEFDPMTVSRQEGRQAPIFEEYSDGLPKAELDEIGRFVFRQRVEAAGPTRVDFVVFDEKNYICPPVLTARSFSILVPDWVGAREVELTLVENIFYVVITDGAGEPLIREILSFTAGDVSWHVSEQVVDQVRSSLSQDLPGYMVA